MIIGISRKDEKRYVYPYAEHDLEETKNFDKEVEVIKKKEVVKTKKKKEKDVEHERKSDTIIV